MKLNKKIRVLATAVVAVLSLCLVLSLCAFAAEAEDVSESDTLSETVTLADRRLGDIKGEELGLSERITYAVQGTVTGLLMVFAVLALLWGIVSLSKVFLYDIPNKNQKEKLEDTSLSAESSKHVEGHVAQVVQESSDGELAAVITAAIATMIESDEYKNEFANGFRVVSFKRVTGSGAWNKRQ